MSLNRIFIANRGEIAARIIATCRELGVESVLGVSEADQDGLPARLATRAMPLGGSKPADSYLNTAAILRAAQEAGCDAVHPGYGFLSENADFAEACRAAGLTFIGPSAETIRSMGDKAQARRIAQAAEVPVIPGSDGPVTDTAEATRIARHIGYPLLIKAAAGGGGRGMRIVWKEDDLSDALDSAAREAGASFGSAAVYIEKYLERVRHVEVQVIGSEGQVIDLGERDCSIQRRHQKLLEETPSPVLSPDQRRALSDAACRLARAVDYCNAGTVEFVVDVTDGRFYFIEMNTRIQVEHPVTEAVTGFDIVALQLAVAGGGDLPDPSQISFDGHAIECRINAEDPDKGFLPRTGTITAFTPPRGEGVRLDTHVEAGSKLTPHYDSLIAKLVVHGPDRDTAIARMRAALDAMQVEGVPTTIPFHRRLLDEPDFLSGNVHTRYVKDVMWAGKPMQQLL